MECNLFSSLVPVTDSSQTSICSYQSDWYTAFKLQLESATYSICNSLIKSLQQGIGIGINYSGTLHKLLLIPVVTLIRLFIPFFLTQIVNGREITVVMMSFTQHRVHFLEYVHKVFLSSTGLLSVANSMLLSNLPLKEWLNYIML